MTSPPEADAPPSAGGLETAGGPERPEVIAARLARFGTTRNARDLWPDLPAAAFRAAQEEVTRVAVAALSDSPGPVSLRPPPGSNARALGIAAFAGSIGGLVGHWCETDRIMAEPAVLDLFAVHLDHARRRAARMRAELERVLVALGDQGIEVCVFKGMHTAYRYFPEPGARTARDIDLLVRRHDWHGARAALRRLGFVETILGPGDVLARSDAVTATLPNTGSVPTLEYTHADHPWSVDLHRSLDFTPVPGLTASFGSPDLAVGDVWHEFRRPVRVLPQPLLLAYLAVHTANHFYAMTQGRLIELVLITRSDFVGRPERWRAFEALVASTGTARFVFPALDLAERLVPGTIDGAVLERLAAATPWTLRRIVRATRPASPLRLYPSPGARERLVWVGSLKEALLALAWLVWPRHGERPASLGTAWQAQWRRVRRALRRIVQARIPR